jgi:chemotaxis methyl-accepting protein methylase
MKESNKLISNHILQSKGIDLSRFDENFLFKCIQRRMVETHCKSKEDYFELLNQKEIECEEFLNSLQISYSEFFRNPLTFSVLEKVVLPALTLQKVRGKRDEIRIWSAACAGGQETYSISMLLNEFRSGGGDELNYRIFSTDMAESQIIRAKKGQYELSELSMLTLKRKKEWFTKKGDAYVVKTQLKEKVDFSVFDLLNENSNCPPASIFGDFDIIFCANLLFYFKKEFRTKILEKLSYSLAKGGLLITGETEREILIQQNYREVYPQSAIFCKKSAVGSR